MSAKDSADDDHPGAERPGGVLQAADRRAGSLGAGTYAFLLCLVTLPAVGAVGLVVRQPLLFPSLGPTVMLFFDAPTRKAAAPRNTLVGHGIAILAGAAALALFGLTAAPPVIQGGITGPRIGAAALSVAVTVLVLRVLTCPHPPAGATTMIISLGLLASPQSCSPSPQPCSW